MSSTQSSDLLRFMDRLNIDAGGNLITNVLDEEGPNFVSRFYTPHFKVNNISEKVFQMIQYNDIIGDNRGLDRNSMTYKLVQSGLKLEDPKIYQLAQACVLDAFSLIYAIEEEESLIKYMDEEDILHTRETVQYLIDYMGSEDRFSSLVMDLMSMDTALGYIQGQVPILKREQQKNAQGTIY